MKEQEIQEEVEYSIISPVYGAEKIVGELVTQIEKYISRISDSYEIILVEDNSPDDSWKEIQKVCQENTRVRGVRLSKNFGQHKAISCGLDLSKGKYVFVMDCDLQHHPKDFKLFVDAMKSNDIVYGIHSKRKHSFLKNLTAGIFYYFYNLLSDVKHDSFGGELSNFVLMKRKVVNSLCQIREENSHFLLNLRLIGFNYSIVEIEHLVRYEGKSSYKLKKLITHAVDGLTAHSAKILYQSIYLGLILFLISIIFGSYVLLKFFINGSIPGYTSIISIMIFLAGIILFMLGITGLYIGKIFTQVKNRPLYHINEILN